LHTANEVTRAKDDRRVPLAHLALARAILDIDEPCVELAALIGAM
jgi:hypothetical protein